MRVRSLGQEDPLEEGMATLSSILAWRPWTEEPGGLWSLGLQRIGHDWRDLACMSAPVGLDTLGRKAWMQLNSWVTFRIPTKYSFPSWVTHFFHSFNQVRTSRGSFSPRLRPHFRQSSVYLQACFEPLTSLSSSHSTSFLASWLSCSFLVIIYWVGRKIHLGFT